MISFRSPSEFGGSLADSDSLRSRESNRPKLSEVHYIGYIAYYIAYFAYFIAYHIPLIAYIVSYIVTI